MVRLRRVDAEQPDGLVGRAGTAHDDRVAVEHLYDAIRLIGRTPLVAEPPPECRRPQHRGGGQGDHDHGPGADHAGTVPPTCDAEQRLLITGIENARR